ncbi:MAG: MFS transporter, partial [Firmicutes bacterium]|nr:MFS transporter [Bacillota bacterium]
MEPWRRTLYILWAANFIMMAGMSLVIPFLPIYIEHLGVHPLSAVERWSGIVFSGTFMISAFVQPLWGKLADRKGRKLMLVRSSLGMAFFMAAMGLAQN